MADQVLKRLGSSKPPHSMASLANHTCAYCDAPATSRDHVPPKAWFVREVRKRIRVPACDLHNNGSSKDDDEFRVLLSLLAGDKTPTQKKLLHKAGKTLKHQPNLRAELVASMFNDAKSGQPGVSFPREKFEAAMVRVARGLHRHHYGENIAINAPIKVWRLKAKPYEQFRQGLAMDLQSDHVGHDQFTYLHGRPIEDPSLSIWLMAFYRSVFVGVITGREIEDEKPTDLAA